MLYLKKRNANVSGNYDALVNEFYTNFLGLIQSIKHKVVIAFVVIDEHGIITY